MSSTKLHRHVVVVAVWAAFFRVALALTPVNTAAKTSVGERDQLRQDASAMLELPVSSGQFGDEVVDSSRDPSQLQVPQLEPTLQGTLMRHELPSTGHQQQVRVPGEHATLKGGHILADMAPEERSTIPREEIEKLEMQDPDNIEDVVDPAACKEQRAKQTGGVLMATRGSHSRSGFTPINCGEHVATSCSTCGPWNQCNGECEWRAPGYHYGSLDWQYRGVCTARPRPQPEEPGQITHPAPVLGDDPSQLKMDPCKRLEHAMAPLVVRKHTVVTIPEVGGTVQLPDGTESDDIIYSSESKLRTNTNWLKAAMGALGVCCVCCLCAIGGSVVADKSKVKNARKERDRARRLQEEARQAFGAEVAAANAAAAAEPEEDF